jgi:Pvc16 N-terminal domain
VIHDVDETLRSLIKRDVVNGSSIEISFEAPTREWAAKRTNPTINVYLYDIREDLSRREVFFEDVRDDSGKVIERRQPPRRFRLTYLMTAWTQRPEDEHRLLSNLLACFLQQDFLPTDLLTGSLRDAGRVVISSVAIPIGQEKQISEVWSALGGELKPSLDLSIVAPMEVGKSMPAGPPVTEQPRFVVARPDAEPEEPAQAGGGKRKKGAPATADRDDQPAAVTAVSQGAWSADETVRAGRKEDPGRVVRVKQWPAR